MGVGDVDAGESGAGFEDGDFYFFEYFCDVLFSDEVEGESFVGVVPWIGYSI